MFALYPLILLGFVRHAREDHRGLLAMGTLALSALLASHHPSSLLFAPSLAFVLICLIFEHRSLRRTLEQGTGVLLSAALACVVWLPALVEKSEVQVDRLLSGPLQYLHHFLYPIQLILSTWGFGLSVPGPQDDMSFALGWPALLLGCTALMLEAFAQDQPDRPRAFTSVLVMTLWVLFLCYCMTPLSRVLWDQFALLHYVQFPWRLLGPVTLFTALVSGLGCAYLGGLTGKPRATTGVCLFFLMLAGASHARPQGYTVFEKEAWTPERIAARGVRVATLSEYAPRVAQFQPRTVRDQLRLVQFDARFRELQAGPESWSARIVADDDSTVEAFLAYYPGWKVKLNDRPVEIQVYSPTGLIRFHVPAGTHELRIDFEWSAVQVAAGWITITGCALLLLWLLSPLIGQPPGRRWRLSPGSRQRILLRPLAHRPAARKR